MDGRFALLWTRVTSRGDQRMADPQWNWLDPRAWLWAACGAVGLILFGLIVVPLVIIGWLFELADRIKER